MVERSAEDRRRGRVMRPGRITRAMVQAYPQARWVFGDNMARIGLAGQASAMRGEPNAIGVPTKWRPSQQDSAHFTDADANHPLVRQAIDDAFREIHAALEAGRDVYIPADGIGTGRAGLWHRAPRLYRAIGTSIALLTRRYPTGSAAPQERLGLAELMAALFHRRRD